MFEKYGNVRSVRSDIYTYDKTLSHILRVYILYHVYLFILNMQKPFPA